MYSALLSVLLLGLWPGVSTDHSLPMAQALPVSPPALHLEIPERLSASGVVIFDLESGQAIYGKQADIERPMASITKLMTALIITENHEMSEIVRIPESAAEVVGNKSYLPVGEDFTVGDLMSALLIPSANDAAVTLAIYHSGSSTAFVEEMNERARELGLKNTSYADPAGLDYPNQYSSPQDIAWLTAFALRQSAIASRMTKPWARIYSVQGTEVALNHTHLLLHQPPATAAPEPELPDAIVRTGIAEPVVLAGKTGTTDAAQQCLVSVVEYGNRKFVVVLLHSNHRYKDMELILSIFRKLLV